MLNKFFKAFLILSTLLLYFVKGDSDVDFIVIGAGTSGLSLATRLSESGQHKVLVIEAGESGFNDSRIDSTYGLSAVGSIYDWNYTTTRQSEFELEPVTLPRGKVLGGTSALNGYGWDRPSYYEIDAWSNLGNEGWTWNDLLPYMKRSETFEKIPDEILHEYNVPNFESFNSSAYGTSGPIHATISNYVPDYAKKWLPAFEEIGVQNNFSPFDGINSGAGINPSSINPNNFTRSYSASAYYFPNSQRDNLEVITGAQVTKLTLEDNQITGVDYVKNNEKFTTTAKKEIILSAGAIGTPQILELSGIGSKDVLERFDIDVKLELPGVGENFQDHTAVSTIWELRSGVTSKDRLKFDEEFYKNELDKFRNDDFTSIFASTSAPMAYVNTSTLFEEEEEEVNFLKDIENWVNDQKDSKYYEQYKEQLKIYKFNIMEYLVANGFSSHNDDRVAEDNKTYISVEAALQHPLSRGSVHIQSSDANDHPLIEANYFAVDFDAIIQTNGLKSIRNLMNTEPMMEIIEKEVYPGQNVTEDKDLIDYWKTAIRSEHHLIGTASMLPRNQNGVVNNELKVYGIKNLRIVDASIIPLHVSAHIQALLYGIAEKASDMILNSQ